MGSRRDLERRVRAALKPTGAHVELVDTGERYWRLNLTWGDGSRAKVDLYGTTVEWKHLASRRRGLYTDLCAVLPGVFAAAGYERMVATITPGAERAVRRKLDWQPAEYVTSGGDTVQGHEHLL